MPKLGLGVLVLLSPILPKLGLVLVLLFPGVSIDEIVGCFPPTRPGLDVLVAAGVTILGGGIFGSLNPPNLSMGENSLLLAVDIYPESTLDAVLIVEVLDVRNNDDDEKEEEEDGVT